MNCLCLQCQEVVRGLDADGVADLVEALNDLFDEEWEEDMDVDTDEEEDEDSDCSGQNQK